MIEFYRYLYYRLYSWNLKTWGEKDVPQFNAMLGVSFTMMIHLFLTILIIQFIGVITNKYSFHFFIEDTPKLELVLLFVFITVINYFWFIKDKKFLKLTVKYKNETKQKRITKSILLWALTLGSLVIIFTIAIIIGKIERGEL